MPGEETCAPFTQSLVNIAPFVKTVCIATALAAIYRDEIRMLLNCGNSVASVITG